MARVEFTSWGSANRIGASCHTLSFDGFRVAIDFGAGVRSEELEPALFERPHVMIISHGHRDHGGLVPRAVQRWPGLKVLATYETTRLLNWIWNDEIKIAHSEFRIPPFTEEDIERANRAFRGLKLGVPVALTDVLSVTAWPAGHILGAVTLQFVFRGASYIVTGDISLHDHEFVRGAQIPSLESCELLVRESTYAGQWPTTSREDTKAELVAEVTDVLSRGGRVIIPSLAIDRLPEVFATLHRGGIDKRWPLWVVGGKDPVQIYHENAPAAGVLGAIRRFRGRMHYEEVMRSRRPLVVLASSGMVNAKSPSYAWATSVLEDSGSAIFMVNWQDPCSPGGIILHGDQDGEIDLPDGAYRKHCAVRRFDLSTHAKEDEMHALEESVNPKLVVHVHGEDATIQGFIDSAAGATRVRAKAVVGERIDL